jgi:hypothetical protein
MTNISDIKSTHSGPSFDRRLAYVGALAQDIGIQNIPKETVGRLAQELKRDVDWSGNQLLVFWRRYENSKGKHAIARIEVHLDKGFLRVQASMRSLTEMQEHGRRVMRRIQKTNLASELQWTVRCGAWYVCPLQSCLIVSRRLLQMTAVYTPRLPHKLLLTQMSEEAKMRRPYDVMFEPETTPSLRIHAGETTHALLFANAKIVVYARSAILADETMEMALDAATPFIRKVEPVVREAKVRQPRAQRLSRAKAWKLFLQQPVGM